MEIQEIIEDAKSKNGLKSDRALCRAIGITSAAMVRIRSGYGHPSDQTMIRLGDLAGLDHSRSLLLLNMWRSDGEAKKTYADLLHRLTTAALCFVMVIGFLADSPALAAEKMFHYDNATVYYGK